MDIMNIVSQFMGGNEINKLSDKIGATPDQTQSAIQSLLPTLIGGMAKNASNPEGANALSNALEKDHDGGILENIGQFFGQGDTATGNGILKHVLADNRGAVENQVAQSSGLNAGQTSNLMAMLAPVLMGAMGKAKKEGGLDAGGLSGMLSGMASKSGVSGGILGMLDKNGDGQVMDDVQDMAKNLLGGFFGKK